MCDFRSMLAQQKKEIHEFQQRLKINPNDIEALNKLASCYEHGLGGLPRDIALAQSYRERAAKLGHPDYEYRQDAMLLQFKQEMKVSDIGRKQAAESIFNDIDALEAAIRTDIFPNVVSFMTNRGVIGTGFFQCPTSLVSNAHVLPCPEVLADSRMIDFDHNSASLDSVKLGFYRDSRKPKSPDVVVINSNSRPGGNSKSISTEFFDGGDGNYEYRIAFYVYFNYESQIPEIKYLIPCSEPGTYPIKYECADDIEPQHGCSGAPVIEARVLIGSKPMWQFRAVGAVYARYFDEQKGKYLVCAIPVIQEFEQIYRDIISPRVLAERAEQDERALAASSYGKDEASQHSCYSEMYAKLEQCGLKDFFAGKTRLDIEVPDGLEKLLGTGIIALGNSAFLPEIQKRYNIHNRRLHIHSLEELETDFRAFLDEIRSYELLRLPQHHGDDFLLSPKGYFRVDVTGGISSRFVLDVQDNIGKRGQHTPPPLDEPISSKFAIAIVPNDSISGAELADLFERSQKIKVPQIVQASSQQVQSDYKKAGKLKSVPRYIRLEQEAAAASSSAATTKQKH